MTDDMEEKEELVRAMCAFLAQRIMAGKEFDLDKGDPDVEDIIKDAKVAREEMERMIGNFIESYFTELEKDLRGQATDGKIGVEIVENGLDKLEDFMLSCTKEF